MKKRKQIHKPKLVRFIVTYGLHILFILVLVNVILFYTVRWYSHGASCLTRQQVVQDNRCLYIWGKQVFEQGTQDAPYQGIPCGADLNVRVVNGNGKNLSNIASSRLVSDVCIADQTVQTIEVASGVSPAANAVVSGSISTTPTSTPIPTPTPIPGPILDLSFTFPGIGSGGGTMNPLHKIRPVIIYLYPPNVSVYNKNIKPAYTVLSTVTFDDNTYSPTYTQFLNHHIDLGGNVKDSQYQVFFKIDQALPKLITKRPGEVAGVAYQFNHFTPPQIPLQSVIVGDIAPSPHGDGVMDINDYKALVGCFGLCLDKQSSDLDDNGVVDGVDYNILLSSFRTLLSLGYPIPTQIPIKPRATISQIVKSTIQPTHKISGTPIAVKTTTKKPGSPLAGILFFLLFLLLVGGGFFAWKRGFLKSIKLPGKQPPAEEVPTETQAPEATIERSAQIPQSSTNANPVSVNVNVNVNSADKPTEEQPVHITATQDTDPVGNEYFVKKRSIDEKGGGIWLTLTDDSGQHLAYYKGADADIKEGFATVKGTMTKEGDNNYLYISEIKFEE